MTSAKEIEDVIAEMTGTKGHEWSTTMAPMLALGHPTAGRFVLFGDDLYKVVPFDPPAPQIAHESAKCAPETTDLDLQEARELNAELWRALENADNTTTDK